MIKFIDSDLIVYHQNIKHAPLSIILKSLYESERNLVIKNGLVNEIIHISASLYLSLMSSSSVRGSEVVECRFWLDPVE